MDEVPYSSKLKADDGLHRAPCGLASQRARELGGTTSRIGRGVSTYSGTGVDSRKESSVHFLPRESRNPSSVAP